ncbi:MULTISPECIES: hypothetical protein [Azospirillum]|uniref:Uncharacterized protein n=1 Tax=Azospirillum brasilense TaxID=192 RepID=A0ABU4PHM4_AZOBR|nr:MULTISPECIES: hypothetical protein [Azospirillum]MDX5956004.1 hypothetical protein [Azospirillum brasilense]
MDGLEPLDGLEGMVARNGKSQIQSFGEPLHKFDTVSTSPQHRLAATEDADGTEEIVIALLIERVTVSQPTISMALERKLAHEAVCFADAK